MFYDTVVSMVYNDSSYLTWDPTTSPSSATLTTSFAGQPQALPQAYADVVVIQDPTPYTFLWFASLPNATITVPAGPLTLSGLMDAVSQSSTEAISIDDFETVTGETYGGDGSIPTIGDAVRCGQSSVQLSSLAQLDEKTMFLRFAFGDVDSESE